MRYVWFEATEIFLLIDMKEQTVIGSILTGSDCACIIRYGHHPMSEPMQEELVDTPYVNAKRYQNFIKAAAVVEAKMLIPSNECDDRAIIRHAKEMIG